ncbi:hypothetical protein HQ545_00535 [Candidatus Woesearchaeota archaeon]|nr:hypothetical protein [Candidatus Woesearchaeota archaeon]
MMYIKNKELDEICDTRDDANNQPSLEDDLRDPFVVVTDPTMVNRYAVLLNKDPTCKNYSPDEDC